MSAAEAVVKASALPGTAALDENMEQLSMQVQGLDLQQLEALLEDFVIILRFFHFLF